jgi:hypothetical protein
MYPGTGQRQPNDDLVVQAENVNETRVWSVV